MTAEDEVAVAAEHASRSADLDELEALRVEISRRVSLLRAASDAATADQVEAQTAVTAAASWVEAVNAYPVAFDLGYMALVRDQVALLWGAIATLSASRARMDDGYAHITTDIADLATVVAARLEG